MHAFVFLKMFSVSYFLYPLFRNWQDSTHCLFVNIYDCSNGLTGERVCSSIFGKLERLYIDGRLIPDCF